MNLTFDIEGGDFTRAGHASSEVKKMLKQLGVDSKCIKNIVIALYEAEVNVVAHAFEGKIEVAIDDDKITIRITDKGPGIPDINLAMKEGYSTASKKVRDMGFGAGMGLPNIKRNTHDFKIESEVNKGTTLTMTNFLMEAVETYHALKVNALKCIGCTHCMKVCPTEAIRVRDGLANIDQNRCVDCGRCMRACPEKAIYVEQDDLDQIKEFKYRVVLFPSVMIGQFQKKYNEDQIYAALLKIGFTHVFEVEQPIEILKESTHNYCKNEQEHKPHISSFCPAVVRLIKLRYPSLLENLIQRKAPHDLGAHFAIQELKKQGAKEEEIGLFYVTPCIAKIAAVKSPVDEKESIVDGILNMNSLYNRVMKVIEEKNVPDTSKQRKHLTSDGILWSLTRGESIHFGERSIAIDGIHNVVRFLERLENEEIPDIDFLELRACDQSCAGGILMSGNRFLTVERLECRAKRYPTASDCKEKLDHADVEIINSKLISDKIDPDPVFKLDDNRAKALEKMQRAQRIICFLPGIDCGACGAPNCHALAEDMVQGKAKMSDCIFLQQLWQDEGKIKASKALKNVEKKWGIDRFQADCNKRGRRNEGF